MFEIKASRESIEIRGEGTVNELLILYSQVTQSVARAAGVAFHPDALKLEETYSTGEEEPHDTKRI